MSNGRVYRGKTSAGKTKKNFMVDYIDAHGKRRRISSGQSSEAAAWAFLEERLKLVELEKRGIITHQDTAHLHLGDLLGDFCNHLESLGRVGGYVFDVETTLGRLFDLAQTKTVAGLTTQVLTKALRLFHQGHKDFKPHKKMKPRRGRTVNKARGFAVHFFRWLEKQELWEGNPAEKTDRVAEHDSRIRRSLSPEDFQRLLKKVPRYRQMVYLFASRTGMRRAAIGQLLWEDVDLKLGTVTTRVLRAKNRREKVKPLAPDLLRELKLWRNERPAFPKAKVFPKVPLCPTLKKDLESIGVEKTTADGTFDFHALKVQLGADLARNNVSIVVAKELLDHSDIRLTANIYSKIDMKDQRAGLEALQSLDPDSGAIDREEKGKSAI